MRLLRLVGLLATLAAAYCAAYIFEHRTLIGFLPSWAVERSPALYSLMRWLPADLMVLAWWLSAGAAIGFGLLASSWPGYVHSPVNLVHPATRWRSGQVVMIMAVVLSSAAALGLAWRGQDGLFVQAIWAAAIWLFLAGAALAARPATRRSSALAHGDPAAPERYWPYLALLLLVCAGALGWRAYAMPGPIDEQVAELGLQAQRLASGADGRLFANTSSVSPPVSPLATATLAIMQRVSNNIVAAIAVTGLLSGLLAVAAVWLVGCELFRRKAQVGQYREPVEDTGAWVALLAAALFATSTLLLHFGGLPVYLEPVAWGTLALWALLRGLRTGDSLAVGLSGVLTGWAALLYPSGLVFAPVALCWWLGVWLLQPAWLQPARRGSGLTWVGGFATAVAPQVALWLIDPKAFVAHFSGTLLPMSPEILMTFSLRHDSASLPVYPTLAFNPVLALFAILAVGNLLLNLDRLAGWALFTWCVVALIVGNALAAAPAYWPALLPVLPALALALAFTIDRVRLTLLETVGNWAAQATTYLVIGLVAWSALWSWLEYFYFVQTHHDAAGQTALLIRGLPPERLPILAIGEQPAAVNWASPALRLLAGPRLLNVKQQTLTPGKWPASLPPQGAVLVQPNETALLGELQAQYPGGEVTTARDRHGNPLLYFYFLP